MRPYYLSLLFIAAIGLCSFNASTVINKDGITFSLPEGWKITDEDDLEGKGYYLSCEKEGANSSGLFAVSWANATLDVRPTLEQYVESLKANLEKAAATPKFDPIKAGTYNKGRGLKCTYTMTMAGVKHRGTLYCLNLCGKTVTVTAQEALEDIESNKAGFKELEASFKCAEK
jgi:hypothetical protein